MSHDARRTGTRGGLLALLALALGAWACMPPQEPDGAGSAGSSGGRQGSGGGQGGGAGGQGGGSAGAGGGTAPGGAGGTTGAADAGGGPATPAGSCDELRIAPAGADGTLALTVEATLTGKPLAFAEANRFGAGSITPTNVRFYIAEPYLLRAGGGRLPVDLVAADGRPLPYNVTLISLESPETLSLRLRAPVGNYEGLGFLFGVGDACNSVDPARQKAPLGHSSQMTWPHEAGYLFLRYEAQVTGGADAPVAIHMGGKIGQIFAPDVSVLGKVAVAKTGAAATLRVAIEQLFAGAALDATVPGDFGPPSPEAIAGEHLRQNLGKVRVFSLAGP
jgi:hypothetical protein